ncbi:MAG: hypothetical protein JW912_07635 [Sedimentisphaerales bacterium]|nr:hypothetical protein [Sedimentisphaerales bacterium]
MQPFFCCPKTTMEILSNTKLKRLRQAIDYSRQKLQPFREQRYETIRQYVGFHYSDNGAADRVPINLLELAINIYTQQMAARSPKALVTTPFRQLKPIAANFELAINQLVKEIRFGDSLRLAVIDALFSVGIIKSGLERKASVEIEGFLHDVGQPFADVISLDNWVHDTTATKFEQCQFMGDRYRLPLELVKQSKAFKNTDDLQATVKNSYNEGGDSKSENLSHGSQTVSDEYVDHIELWDLWLPFENVLVTIPAEGEGKPLRIVQWDGPETGPYHLLTFSPVPGNIMPLAPSALWMDLHDLANRMFRKLGRQAERQKTVLGVQSGSEDDGNRIIKVNDGEALRMDSPDRAREYKFGGIDQPSLAFLLQVKDLFAYLGGNLDSLGGLSPMADTLGQDQLLAQNASKRVADMQDRVIDFTKQIINSLGFYLWNDPLIELPLTKRVPGFEEISVPVTFGPDSREGDFLDYNLDIEPYSMQHQSPQMKLQTLTQVFGQFIVPFAPMMAEQGIGVNFESLLKMISKYANVTELNDILEFSQSTGINDRPMVGRFPQKMGTTKHISERINRPGATRHGKDAALTQLMLGGDVQPSEKAAIGRPTG